VGVNELTPVVVAPAILVNTPCWLVLELVKLSDAGERFHDHATPKYVAPLPPLSVNPKKPSSPLLKGPELSNAVQRAERTPVPGSLTVDGVNPDAFTLMAMLPLASEVTDWETPPAEAPEIVHVVANAIE
jgi:hypothetical protein